jgi:CpeT protein
MKHPRDITRAPKLKPLLALTALTLNACGGSTSATQGGESAGTQAGAGAQAGERPPEDPTVTRAQEWLTGLFDSSEQAASSPSYFPIQLHICPISAPEIGERVLYVEQARMDTPTQPYRQRLYVVSAEAEGVARSDVYELTEPASWVGACASATPRAASAADATLKAGCAVFLTWDEAQSTLTGGTRGSECASTLADATYATSEVTLTADELRSWDRGFNDLNVQMWGATEGPYIFKRR